MLLPYSVTLNIHSFSSHNKVITWIKMGSHRTQRLALHPLSSVQSLIPPPGEAAGLALGLVMLGSKSAQAIEDMVGYAQETQHEKILRGLAVGIAMVMYGRMEEADALIESLCRDKVGHGKKM